MDFKKLREEHTKDMLRYYLIVSGDKEFRRDAFYVTALKDTVYPMPAQDILDEILTNLILSIDLPYSDIRFIVGDNCGVDTIATEWALSKDYDVRLYSTDWDGDGKAAGFKRNESMVCFAGMKPHKSAILFWNGENYMTRNLIFMCMEYSIPLKVYNYNYKRFLSDNEIEAIHSIEKQKKLESINKRKVVKIK